MARFLAYLSDFDFTVASDTTTLLEEMVNEGQLSELAPERVLMEVNKALGTGRPDLFFGYLLDIGADRFLWPELAEAAIQRLKNIQSTDADTRFAALMMDLNAEQITSLCRRLKCTNQRRDLCLLVATELDRWLELEEMTAQDIVNFLYRLDALRKHERFRQFCLGADAIAHCNLASRWLEFSESVREVKARDVARGLTGPAVGEAVKTAQIAKVEACQGVR